MNSKIGIIGKGFVGSAVAHGFSDQTGYSAQIKIYDTDPLRSSNSLDETVNDSEFIFLSVPTPANLDGSVNLDIVDEALASALLLSLLAFGSFAFFDKLGRIL